MKHFHAPLLARPRFSPNEALCLAHILAAEPAGEIEPLLVKSSLALRLDPDLGSDHDHDAHRLRLCGELVRVELVRQPAEIIVDAVERHAEEMLDIRGWRPPVSARRLVGADDTRQVRESDDAAARARVADGGSARA